MKTVTIIKCVLVFVFMVHGINTQVYGETSENLNVTAGNLGVLLGSEKDVITNLIITGEINGTDIGTLRSMSNLSVLNMADANIVTGGSFAVNGRIINVVNNQIPDCMFHHLTKLTSVEIPNSITSIGDSAFYLCSGLTTVSIPDHVTTIGNFAFHGCTALESFVIGNKVDFIGEAVFCDDIKMKDFIVSESNASFYSEEGILFNKNKSKLIRFPNKKSVVYTIPESVTSLDGHAFCSCSELTSITLPVGLTNIGLDVFFGCTGLAEIHCKFLILTVLYHDPFLKVDKENCKLYVPSGTSTVYSNAEVWGDFKNIIEEALTEVSEIEKNNTTVFTKQDVIVIKNAVMGETVSVYSALGILLRSVKTTDDEIRIAVPANHIYLVRIADRIFKVAV